MTWQTVKLGDILERKKNLIEIEDNKEYKLVTVKLYHKGVTLRKVAKGNELSSSKMHSVKTGEFILSGIDARHGAFGIVPAELEGAVVSNDFWCVAFDEEVIEKQFFLRLTSTTFFDDLCKKASDGTTNRVRLQADKFFNLEITIPPIEEQKDFVQRYSKIEETNHSISTELTHQLALVKELRQAYLREAMQGKLARQESTDEPAEILLEKIKVEKERLVAEKKIKRDQPLPPINAEEIPFDIPSNWTWCRLGEIAEIVRGGSPRPAGDKRFYEGKIPFLKVADLTAIDEIYLNSYTYTIKEAGLHKTRMVEADTLMLTNSGATLGIPKICTFQTTFNDGIAAFLNLVFMDKVFLYYFLKSKSQWYLETASRGQGQPNLNTDIIANTPLTLPPLAEQERIARKLEKLMKFCDELEANILQARANADSLLQTALKESLMRPISKKLQNCSAPST